MKRYKLKKDLPTFKAGQEFWLGIDGQLLTQPPYDGVIVVYSAATLQKFPNIFTDWFEEIPEPLKTVWDLENGDTYYQITKNGYIDEYQWTGNNYDLESRDIGNVFLTQKEAEKELARRKAKQILLRDTKGFKPDWGNTSAQGNKWVYTVYYNHGTNILVTNGYAINHFPCDIWFATEADAEDSIKTHYDEWLCYINIEE